jgi:hypothetical protein
MYVVFNMRAYVSFLRRKIPENKIHNYLLTPFPSSLGMRVYC